MATNVFGIYDQNVFQKTKCLILLVNIFAQKMAQLLLLPLRSSVYLI